MAEGEQRRAEKLEKPVSRWFFRRDRNEVEETTGRRKGGRRVSVRL
jgi:hypothetical protein